MKVVYPPHLDRETFSIEHATQLLYKELGHIFVADKPIVNSFRRGSSWYRPGRDNFKYRRYDRLQYLIGRIISDVGHLQSCGAQIASIEVVKIYINTADEGAKINEANMIVRINLTRLPNMRQHRNCHHGTPYAMLAMVQAANAVPAAAAVR